MAAHEYDMNDPEPMSPTMRQHMAADTDEAQKEIARLKAENEWLREQRDLAIETAEVSQAGWHVAIEELRLALGAALKGDDA